MDLYTKLRELKILLIDDDVWIRDAMRILLAAEGCGLVTCETAEEALNAVALQTFDIIIADYKLPGMNGIAFFEQILTSHPAAVKILISAYLDKSVIAGAIAAGVQKTIEKPFRPETIESALIKLLEKTKQD